MPGRMVMACAVAWAGLLAAVALPVPVAHAQAVAPRLTGAMAIAHLDKARQAVEARAADSGHATLKPLLEQLKHMRLALADTLGADAGKPVATIDEDARAAVVRAHAAASRVQAWLKVSAKACTPDEAKAMLAALALTLDKLASDTASQDAPLPVINAVQTLDKHPLFVFRQGSGATPKFVLAGAHFVDPQCANPEVQVVDAQGEPVEVQPQLVAAQASRVELQWPGVSGLAPGSYVLRLTAQRKRFLFGCTAQPPAIAVVQVMPARKFTVDYTLAATCAGKSGPVTLGSGTLPALTAQHGMSAQVIDTSACPVPGSYTITASVHAGDGQVSTYGPVTQAASVVITTGLGHGMTLSWNPSLHKLFANLGKSTCKGVY